MRVALLGPVAWRTPPHHYGPWEQVTGLLAEGLVARGVDVTLFATLDSVTSATLDGVCPRGYADDPDHGRPGVGGDARLPRAGPLGAVRPGAQPPRLAAAGLRRALPRSAAHHRARLLRRRASCPRTRRARSSYVSISDADRAPELDYVATVHHGVDLAGLPFTREAGPGLVAFGRIHPDKGTHTAIEIARRAGRPLTICGIVQDERYFAEQVAPHIDGDQVVFLGSVGPRRRAEVLGASTALLHPIAFDEPFGLSVVESMVCGTPVVAYRAGIHAGGRRRRGDRVPRAHRRRRPSTRSPGSPASTGPAAGRGPGSASARTGWSPTTWPSTTSSSADRTAEPGTARELRSAGHTRWPACAVTA